MPVKLIRGQSEEICFYTMKIRRCITASVMKSVGRYPNCVDIEASYELRKVLRMIHLLVFSTWETIYC